jgi:hypothetical protein
LGWMKSKLGSLVGGDWWQGRLMLSMWNEAIWWCMHNLGWEKTLIIFFRTCKYGALCSSPTQIYFPYHPPH